MSKNIDSLYPKYGCSGKVDWDNGCKVRGQVKKDRVRQLKKKMRQKAKKELTFNQE